MDHGIVAHRAVTPHALGGLVGRRRRLLRICSSERRADVWPPTAPFSKYDVLWKIRLVSR